MIKVRDLMTADVVALTPDLNLRRAIEALADRGIGGAPVVQGREVVGVLSASDILEFESVTPGVPSERREFAEVGELEAEGEPPPEGEEAPGAYFTEFWSDAGAETVERIEATESPEWDFLGEHTVGEAMSRVVRKVRPDESVQVAARRMVADRIHRLVVLENGRLAGVISSFDIMRAVAEGRL
jgi:CBS domain-containing protein